MKQRFQAWGDTKVLPIVGCFVFNEAGELLLLRRHPENLGGGRWGTPGGRIEPGEGEDTAMLRELREETGIAKAAIIRLGSHEIRMPHGTVHMTSYKAMVPKLMAISLEPDAHTAYAWFGKNDLLQSKDILWGVPTILQDFGLLDNLGTDLTLADGSSVRLLDAHTAS